MAILKMSAERCTFLSITPSKLTAQPIFQVLVLTFGIVYLPLAILYYVYGPENTLNYVRGIFLMRASPNLCFS